MRSILLSAIVFTSCSTLNENKLPKFSLNNITRNNLIVNRKANYGDGRPEGCIVLSEINLSIKTTDKSGIRGEILDVESSKPIPFANLSLFTNNTYKKFNADKDGKFSILSLSKVQKLKISSIGYRNLIIDFNKIKSF